MARHGDCGWAEKIDRDSSFRSCPFGCPEGAVTYQPIRASFAARAPPWEFGITKEALKGRHNAVRFA